MPGLYPAIQKRAASALLARTPRHFLFKPWRALALGAAMGALPLLAVGQSCPGSVNAGSHYILGLADGRASAMHWDTGLVWARCAEGRSWTGSACSGSDTVLEWNAWAETRALLPRSFEGQGHWGLPAGFSQDLLASGAWRMPYLQELYGLSTGCADGPKINREVFTVTQGFENFWTASVNSFGDGAAIAMHFNIAVYSGYPRSDVNNPRTFSVRPVRGGQAFAALPAAATEAAGAGAQAHFAAMTLEASSLGQAWGGARIEGEGSPQFQVNGGAWVSEAIVRSGDQIIVRLTAPAARGASHTATLRLRSGLTTGTPANGANPASENTVVQESTRSFSVQAAAVPAAPPAPTAVGGNGQVALSSSAPGDDGGTPILGYEAEAQPLPSGTPITASCAQPQCSIGGLSNSTVYRLRLRALNAVGPGAWSEAVQSTPHLGDPALPLPGTAGVASVVITGEVPGCNLTQLRFDEAAAAGLPLPDGARLPFGVMRFSVAACTGAHLRVSVTYPSTLHGLQLLKWGPPKPGEAPRWFSNGATLSDDGRTVSWEVADNGAGDNDSATPGVISDPFSPMALPSLTPAIPALGGWGLGLLSLLAAGLGWRGARRRGNAN
jgi:hypothetical protein